MKILYVVTAAGFGGAPQHVLQLMGYVTEQGHKVGLVSAPEPRLLEGARALGVQIFPVPDFVRPVRPWKDIRTLWPVFQAIRNFEPDVVHAHSTKAGYAARLACCFLSQPVIFTAHGWAFSEGRPFWKRWILAQIERFAALHTAKIICVSQYDYNLALQFRIAAEDRLVTIHNGVNPSWFSPARSTLRDVRKELGIPEHEIVITFVGRLDPQKDLFTLLKAVKELPFGRVLIVGYGEDYAVVEKMVNSSDLRNRVFLLGERSDVPEILLGSDIYVLTTNWEGLPYTIIESMMAGLPVVATRVGGVPELVEDGVTGFLVGRKDAVQLKKVLVALLENEALRRQMGQAGKKKALSEFTMDRMFHETLRVYEEVLSQ